MWTMEPDESALRLAGAVYGRGHGPGTQKLTDLKERGMMSTR